MSIERPIGVVSAGAGMTHPRKICYSGGMPSVPTR
jgi:hypothetical protein